MTVAEAIYVLCAGTSLAAAFLLQRQYRANGNALLLWSFVAFVGLAINNVLVYVDLVLVPATDMTLARTIVGAAALLVLLYGLIWET